MRNTVQQAHPSFLSGGGEMGALMRAFDWAATPLGSPHTWPAILKTSVRMLLTSSHPMFIWWGPQLIQFYNDAYRRTMGPELHPGALGQPGRECWPETWHIIGPDIAFVMEGRGATWHENTLVPFTRHGKREEVWWTFGFSPIEDDAGVHGVLAICSEVTEAHRHTAELEESYRALVAWMEYAFCVLEVLFDAAGKAVDYRYLETNPAFEKQSGIVGATGRTIRQIVPDIEDFWPRMYGEVARTGTPQRAVHQAAGLGKWFEIFAFRIGAEGAHKIGVLFKDVTDQTRAAEALRGIAARQEVSLRLADALRDLSAPDDIVATACLILGSELGVARVQYAAVDAAQQGFLVALGWCRAGVAPMPSTTLRLNDFGPEVVTALFNGEAMRVDDVRTDPRTAPFAAAYAGIGVRANLAIPVLKGGELVTILSLHDDVARAWSDEDVLVARDMAERTWNAMETARAQEALRLAVRRKDEFLAMLAHELRNPLAPISAAAQLMTMFELAPARVRQTSQVIQRQVAHMTALVDDLLDVSRVTQGLVHITRAPQDMQTILANAVEQSRPLIEAQGHLLSIALPAQAAQVDGDAKRLVQVFVNLLNNAAKYTPAGGAIRLTMDADQDEVRVMVEDNGVGITPELQPCIFDIFTQGERSIDRATGGLGLGLALVKSLAELHHGSVTCVSAGVGQGSRFTVRLPRCAIGVQAAPVGAPVPAPSATQGALRILLVDDNIDAAHMLKDVLELGGHEVAVEHDPLRAIERAAHGQFDVGLLDIGLPGMDGNALARHLLAQAATRHMVCIAVTGYGREQDRADALAAGFRHHLVKPVDVGHLTSLLARLHQP
ncbi:hybrid sensor histidine kinase/response regulator [Massilia sp. S19_KUP03_FR1]|uniref:hybrid sensor histidine kinase/response regulator n=1 Tax=Massilia sp. S19_KUP03_FR1 TaxID=3025503 RepID=UPI002FCDD16C